MKKIFPTLILATIALNSFTQVALMLPKTSFDEAQAKAQMAPGML